MILSIEALKLLEKRVLSLKILKEMLRCLWLITIVIPYPKERLILMFLDFTNSYKS